jgi:hypothetical protein
VRNRCKNGPRKRLRKRCGRRGSPAKAAPDEANREKEHGEPEKQRYAELKQDAKKERDRGESRTNSLDKGISKLKRLLSEICLKRGAVVFDQRNANDCAHHGRDQTSVLALGFDHGFIGLCDVLLEGDSIPQGTETLAESARPNPERLSVRRSSR